MIKSKEAQAIEENTIPPHYSREMSRYHSPLPIKRREQEKALEKVREKTNGGSKGSKSEKQAVGKLNSLGIMRDWNLTQELKNQSPKEVLKKLNLQKRKLTKESLQKHAPNAKGIMIKKDCTKLLPKEIEKETPPSRDSREVPKEDRKDLGPKWNFQKGDTVIDKDTKQWVDEQNKF